MSVQSSSTSITAGRVLLTAVSLLTSFGPYAADFNKTHIYNPRWPPHAKFHTGQTMSMGFCLGLLTIYYTWRRSPDPRDSLNTASLIGSLYWITQLSAILYPGTAGMDPEFGEGFPQLWLSTGFMGIVGAGYWLESTRLAGAKVASA